MAGKTKSSGAGLSLAPFWLLAAFAAALAGSGSIAVACLVLFVLSVMAFLDRPAQAQVPERPEEPEPGKAGPRSPDSQGAQDLDPAKAARALKTMMDQGEK